MDEPEEEPQPFDERAALEQLEQFKNDIERYRQQRKTAGEEFDQFVKSFKAPQAPAPQRAATPAVSRPAASRPPEPPRVQTPRVEPAARVPSSPVPPPPGAPPESQPAVSTHAAADATPAATERISAERAHGRNRPSPVMMVALLLLAAGVAAWFLWPQPADDAVNAPATTAAPAPQTPAVAPAQPAAPPTPPPAAPSTETVVTTLAPVWLRVIADGVKVREDEVPAGTRIPVDVQKTLVIRTGNAAAVSLVLRGKDLGALGNEGQVVTRTFTVPER